MPTYTAIEAKYDLYKYLENDLSEFPQHFNMDWYIMLKELYVFIQTNATQSNFTKYMFPFPSGDKRICAIKNRLLDDGYIVEVIDSNIVYDPHQPHQTIFRISF